MARAKGQTGKTGNSNTTTRADTTTTTTKTKTKMRMGSTGSAWPGVPFFGDRDHCPVYVCAFDDTEEQRRHRWEAWGSDPRYERCRRCNMPRKVQVQAQVEMQPPSISPRSRLDLHAKVAS